MPRLSLYRPNKGNDYKFFDRRISEMFTVGGVDINLHKYLGPNDQSRNVSTSAGQIAAGTVLTFSSTTNINKGDFVAGSYIPNNTKVSSKTATTITLSASTTGIIGAGQEIKFYASPTQPAYATDSITNIQDLLFLENRDRKYDTSVYTMRTIYRMNDNDFDLSQFGLFLTGDTMFMVFHLNDMIETIGRKIIVGDVLELPNLKDFYALDEGVPAALKRYYVVNDATRAAEGFAPTWYPHLWRVKVQPLVDSQEYKDILNTIKAGENTDNTLADVLSTYNKYIGINDAIVARAETEVPASGYDTSSLYTAPIAPNNTPGDPLGLNVSLVDVDTSTTLSDASSATVNNEAKIDGYLTGDGLPPNGAAVAAGVAFPASPMLDDYYLRLDYIPNRLFRFDGRRWIKIEDAVRTNLTPGPENTTLRSSFVNNTNTVRSSGKALASDIIRAASPYTAPANAATSSFTLSTKTVITKTAYTTNRSVEAFLNRIKVASTVANASGNLSFTVSATVTSGDLIEYTVYETTTSERQSLSNALKPTADN
jgi:hypothetical protein